MASATLSRIRAYIRQGKYDMSRHAMDEMAEDGLDIIDIEHTILHGRLTRVERDDPRGTKHIIEGHAADRETPVGVVGRMTNIDRYLIITVYVITNREE